MTTKEKHLSEAEELAQAQEKKAEEREQLKRDIAETEAELNRLKAQAAASGNGPVVAPMTVQPQALAFYSQWGDYIDYYNSGGTQIAAGTVIFQGTICGVTTHFIDPSRWGAVAIERAFDFLKKSGDAPTVGTSMYWDGTNLVATVTSTGNTLIGRCVKAALATDARVRVKLNF